MQSGNGLIKLPFCYIECTAGFSAVPIYDGQLKQGKIKNSQNCQLNSNGTFEFALIYKLSVHIYMLSHTSYIFTFVWGGLHRELCCVRLVRLIRRGGSTYG